MSPNDENPEGGKFDPLLDSLRKHSPSELDVHRWQMAVQRELSNQSPNRFRLKWALQLTAAMLVGAILGGALVGNFRAPQRVLPEQSTMVAQNSGTKSNMNVDQNATFERSNANLD